MTALVVQLRLGREWLVTTPKDARHIRQQPGVAWCRVVRVAWRRGRR
jgi:hypothetical protein